MANIPGERKVDRQTDEMIEWNVRNGVERLDFEDVDAFVAVLSPASDE